MRQPVRPRVQLAVGELRVLVHDRDGVRVRATCASNSSWTQCSAATRYGASVRVPLHQHSAALGFGEQRQPLDVLVVAGHHRREHAMQVAQIPLDRRAVEQRRRVLQAAHDPAARFGEVERQVELRDRIRRAHRLDLEPRQRGRDACSSFCQANMI